MKGRDHLPRKHAFLARVKQTTMNRHSDTTLASREHCRALQHSGEAEEALVGYPERAVGVNIRVGDAEGHVRGLWSESGGGTRPPSHMLALASRGVARCHVTLEALEAARSGRVGVQGALTQKTPHVASFPEFPCRLSSSFNRSPSDVDLSTPSRCLLSPEP